MDQKSAAEQLRKAKEATGRALFESGNWRTALEDGDADSSDEEEEEDDAGDGAFNLERMRRETEALREKKEEERLSKLHGERVGGTSTVPPEEPEPQAEGGT